jgi:hypothetical protein
MFDRARICIGSDANARAREAEDTEAHGPHRNPETGALPPRTRSPSRCCSPPRFMPCRSVCASMALRTGAIASAASAVTASSAWHLGSPLALSR